VDLPQWFSDFSENDPDKDKRLECVTEGGECMYVPRGWWHCVLNLDTCIAITHNVVTGRNLLPAVDFLENIVNCSRGFGCRGGDKFDSSGDVPTSVIYPYQEEVEASSDEEEQVAEAVEGDDLPEGEYCECSAKQKKLLEDWLVALERDKPGLLTRLRQERAVALKKLREEREEKQPWKKALWAEMEGANVVNPKETASTGGAFSFGFSVAGGTSATAAAPAFPFGFGGA